MSDAGNSGLLAPVLFFMFILLAAPTFLKRGWRVPFYLIAALLLAAMNWQPLYESWRLSRSPLSATGTVTRLDCADQGSFSYRIEIPQGRFENRMDAARKGPECKDLHAGDRIPIEYLASDPTVAIAGSAADWFHQTLAYTLGVALFFPAAIVFFWSRRQRRLASRAESP